MQSLMNPHSKECIYEGVETPSYHVTLRNIRHHRHRLIDLRYC